MDQNLIIHISKQNILHNLAIIKDIVSPASIIVVVKSNAYGHGLKIIAKILDQKVDFLGVASISEAVNLREAGIKSKILVLHGVIHPEELPLAAELNLDIVFHNQDQICLLDQATLDSPINAWIKINTGMSRLGFEPQVEHHAYSHLLQHHNTAKPIRIMSHFACSDDFAHPANRQQILQFENFISDKNTEYSMSNSAAIFNFPECNYHFVRPGLAIYGVSPIKNKVGQDFNLKPVMTVKSRLIAIYNRPKHSMIGYNLRYKCSKTTKVGIVSLGYGDGYPVTTRDGAPVLVRGVECPIIGQVSMDSIAIDLSNVNDAEHQDEVILWGDGLPIEKLCSYTNDIPWSILTGVQYHRAKIIVENSELEK